MFEGLDVANLLERGLERTAVTKEDTEIAEKLQKIRTIYQKYFLKSAEICWKFLCFLQNKLRDANRQSP